MENVLEVIYYPDGTTETKEHPKATVEARHEPSKAELMDKIEELLAAVSALK